MSTQEEEIQILYLETDDANGEESRQEIQTPVKEVEVKVVDAVSRQCNEPDRDTRSLDDSSPSLSLEERKVSVVVSLACIDTRRRRNPLSFFPSSLTSQSNCNTLMSMSPSVSSSATAVKTRVGKNICRDFARISLLNPSVFLT